jgi:hypothetical protein
LPTDLTDEYNQLLEDAAKLAAETDALVEARKSLPPASLLALLENIRERQEALDVRQETLATREHGQRIAYKQRVGVEPKPGDRLTAEDVLQGERIAKALLSAPPKGGLKN